MLGDHFNEPNNTYPIDFLLSSIARIVMNQTTQMPTEAEANANHKQQGAPKFPKAILSVSQEEFYGQDSEHEPLELTIRDGKPLKDGEKPQEVELPTDLQGHLFIVAPGGCVDSCKVDESHPETVLPSENGWIPVLNGDGMVYRLDFHRTPTTSDQPATDDQDKRFKESRGKAWLASRLVKTPSYYVDRVLHDCADQYPNLSKNFSFGTRGIARLSMGFGARNQNNTAFLPMKFPGESERLLVTEDIGRPWEINPYSLKLLAPVGLNKEWRGVLKNKLWRFWPFPPVMTSAHPVFDSKTEEVFTTNVVKTFSMLLDISLWLVYKLHELKIPLRKQIAKLFHSLHKWIDLRLVNKLRFDNNQVYLMRWDGKEECLKKWQVMDDDDRPARIEQTLHQMGVTEKYIVLADTSLKIALDDFIPRPRKPMLEAELLWRELTSFPQCSTTTLYIVPREELKPLAKTVKAQKIELPEALVHYLVDYQNPDENIIFHTAHMNAWDTAEFVHRTDRIAGSSLSCDNNDPTIGMVTTATDVSRLTSYVINVKTGQLSSMDVSYEGLPKSEYPWSPAFYACCDDADHKPLEQFQDIYWNSWGLWEDLLTDFIYDMYKDYKNRTQPIEEVLKQAQEEGIAAQLCRVHIERTETPDRSPKIHLSIADRYQFPKGYFGTSAQFVPREGSTGQSLGYIVCIVIHSNHLLSNNDDGNDKSKNWSDNSEIWIFEAENLKQGPKYKISHPKLNFGFTAHTTWLREIKSPPARKYDVCDDYKDWLDNLPRNWLESLLEFIDDPIDLKESNKELKELLKRHVYPHFEASSGDRT